MKRILLSVLLLWFVQQAISQCTAVTYSFDLSSSIDTTVILSSAHRNGDCCTGTNCIRFDLTINPNCSYVNFDVQNPAPNGSAYYQINCGPQTSLATPACVAGMTHVVITYCKPGNDAPDYIITAAGAIQGSPDTTIRQGCTGKMGVKGLIESSVTWTSIYPGPQGAYNSFLSCTAGCDTVNVTPLSGAPAYIDYQVSGSRLCGPVVSDTIRIYTTPTYTVAITPVYPEICPNGGSVQISAAAANGIAPYHYLWNTGDTASTIVVTSAGPYVVSVTDNSGCMPVTSSVNVTPLPVPATPVVITNSPLCVGSTLNLSTATVTNATYSWTGPNGFTSNSQNPVVNNVNVGDAGNYSVTVMVNNCSSISGSANVVVNTIPIAPSASSNTPVCQGNILTLLASNIANANYSWTGPNGFNSSTQNPSISNVSFANGGTYSVTATVNGCTGAAGSTSVSINPLPNLSTSSNSPVCSGTTLSLFANSDPGATFSWTGPNGFSSSSQNPTIPNATTNASGIYSVTALLNGCSTSTTIAITVKPTPTAPIASSNAPICDGSNLNLSASNIANATFNWAGPNGFSSSSQNPVIANATLINAGNYSVTATVNGCTSISANTNVVINPIPSSPVVGSNSPLCVGSTISLTASGGAGYSWVGPNGFSSNNQNPSIANSTINNSGSYSVTSTVNGCTSIASSINVVVNPIPAAPVLSNNSPACVGGNINLNAVSIIGASYSWSGPNGFSSASQNPSLSSVTAANAGSYSAFVTVNGCVGANSSTVVTVNPIPNSPIASNNGSICAGTTLNLSATNIPGANYDWTGPNGFVSASQNNSIPNAGVNAAGQYFVTATVNGCTSVPGVTTANIYQLSSVTAGGNQTICANNSSVSLNGSVTGGSGTGIWTTNGSGSFSPLNTNPNASYIPTAADKALGSVSLTFTSTNNGACAASSSSVVVSFAAMPNANAGNDSTICSNKNLGLKGIIANANGGIWSSSGNGNFSPSNSNLNATYSPGQSDIANGKAILTLTTVGNSFCPADSKSFTLTLHPAPSVNAGEDKVVVINQSVLILPTTTGQGLKALWTPTLYLDNDSSLHPICSPTTDMNYRIVVTDSYGCTAQDDIFVKVLKMPEIPNVFTPNNDGINDNWQIKWLPDYTDCDVEIFNRYGQLVYRSTGYSKPWDGTVNGRQVPAATYYYIINLKYGLKPLSGFVDIVR